MPGAREHSRRGGHTASRPGGLLVAHDPDFGPRGQDFKRDGNGERVRPLYVLETGEKGALVLNRPVRGHRGLVVDRHGDARPQARHDLPCLTAVDAEPSTDRNQEDVNALWFLKT